MIIKFSMQMFKVGSSYPVANGGLYLSNNVMINEDREDQTVSSEASNKTLNISDIAIRKNSDRTLIATR